MGSGRTRNPVLILFPILSILFIHVNHCLSLLCEICSVHSVYSVFPPGQGIEASRNYESRVLPSGG